ncbi:hypothetical protein [Phenylobacterium sp.]|uniref:hypothetical protein n=1 Tax=Phenylobacterium sp. TaxID=1871053 RepID=UPI002FCCA375
MAAEEAFNSAIASDDLSKLSGYLRDEFGEVPLAIYLRDVKLRARLDRYLARLTDYVAAPPAEAATPEPGRDRVAPEVEAPVAGLAQHLTSYWQHDPDDPPQIVTAIDSARTGESWNALARLRRDLEARFRAELMEVDPVASRMPMHKVPVPIDAERFFRRFYRVASRAIHGEEVTEEEIIQSIQDARMVYRTMEQLVPGWSEKLITSPPRKRRAIF